MSDDWDVLHNPGDPESHWSTDNVGEAAPGVLTPLSMSMWCRTGDSMTRGIAQSIGAFDDTDVREHPAIVRPFFGRFAMRAEYLAVFGDRMPGATGEDVVLNLFGRVPETMTFAPTRRRYPAVAAKLPPVMVRAPGELRRLAADTDAWWRAQIPPLQTATLAEARAGLRAGFARFDSVLFTHSRALMAVVQPLLIELEKLVARAGTGDVGALSGTGGAEMAIVENIWQASRGRLSIADVIANHGFHGPLEGEAISRVWREDTTPLERMIGEYAKRDESESPLLREEEARRRLPGLQREVLAALPAARRPAARILLRLAPRIVPLRGVGKRAFLQGLDVARASARRIDELLVAGDLLESTDDAFYLTLDELTSLSLPPDAAELVAQRRQRRADYQQLSIPGSWRGVPEATPLADLAAEDGEAVSGIGASAGVAEGIVRVVLDPTFAEVEPGEVLVTPTTDPSWASIMFLSSALVVDIGGALSHAAVVARELGIPCVVNTRTGSRTLRTGDRVRVDGKAGTVEILERA
jgi:pyruvate,water dikinase